MKQKKYPLRNRLQLDQHQKGGDWTNSVVKYGDNIYGEYQIVYLYRQFQFENNWSVLEDIS